eukprot:TRINITY_DN2947_c0_g1_i1.p1 TRINITY_DN2947_c0_g1~~TRINITY_DN2947_c0_g1_i1.p1  ORF type:complete len:381 (-),score=76.26 TRINITY_DN2947_c0_g1_i1:58-1086(-)
MTEADAIRSVRLPAGWEGLSFKSQADGRLVVAEVPKACFSSAAFAASGALKPQVEGVLEGDEIVSLNGETLNRAVEKITLAGDPWNACSTVEPMHKVGSKGKFDSPPCAACDFIRRRAQLGFDVALQMWLRAVKRELQITLGVRGGSCGSDGKAVATQAAHAPPAETISVPRLSGGAPEPSAVVSLIPTESSRVSSRLELKSLDDLVGEKRQLTWHGEEGSGGGKPKKRKGKGKGKGKGRPPSGPHLPRTQVSSEWATGEVVEWKGKYGWIRPDKPIDHPLATKHKGRIYISELDLNDCSELATGDRPWFQVFEDSSGLGAEYCWRTWETQDSWDDNWDDDE